VRVDHGGLKKFVAFIVKIEKLLFLAYLTVFPHFDINFIYNPRINLKYNVNPEMKP
jgi:hypothetical protein